MEGISALNYTTRSAVGVVGLISPWNLPLYLLSFKIAPAIAFGNTVVCKPSEMTSVTAWMLCKVLDEAGETFKYCFETFIELGDVTDNCLTLKNKSK